MLKLLLWGMANPKGKGNLNYQGLFLNKDYIYFVAEQLDQVWGVTGGQQPGAHYHCPLAISFH